MSSQYNFDAVGLGISFQQQPVPIQYSQPHNRPMTGYMQNDYSEPRHEQQARTHRPDLKLKTLDYPALTQHHPQPQSYQQPHGPYQGRQHSRTQSAIIPQRPTFDRSFPSEPSVIQAPRSAHPVQRPFAAPQVNKQQQQQMMGYVHSAPTTPLEARAELGSYFANPRDARREPPRSETVYDRRQQRRMAIEAQPPPQYYNPTSRYMDSPAQENMSHSDSASTSGKSYFYMTPQIQTTPFSEAGQFPVSENYSVHSNLHTPQLISSPVFDNYREDYYDDRQGHFDERDEMPEEPYVPLQLTNYPPLRPSAFRRSTTDDGRVILDGEDPHSMYASPTSSSPPGTPNLKDRKVAYSRWTSAEDLLLKEAIAKHGDGKWSLVSQMVPGRTPMQCSTRWQGALNTSIHKGRWDPEEDAILIKSVAEWQAWHLADNKDIQSEETLQEELYKNIPWSNIAQLLPRPRTGVQALARWSEALDPRITKGKWTSNEDAALLRGVAKYGKCWIKIANGVRGRTQRQCRTRYCQISDKKRKVRGGPVSRSPELHFSE